VKRGREEKRKERGILGNVGVYGIKTTEAESFIYTFFMMYEIRIHQPFPNKMPCPLGFVAHCVSDKTQMK
jgi:hypothetical protein